MASVTRTKGRQSSAKRVATTPWWRRAWPWLWPGVPMGVGGALLFVVALIGPQMHSGLGPLGDTILWPLVVIALLFLTSALAGGVLWALLLLKRGVRQARERSPFPRSLGALAGLTWVVLLVERRVNSPLYPLFLIYGAYLGFAVQGALRHGVPATLGRVLLAVGLLIGVGAGAWFALPGSTDYLVVAAPQPARVAPLAAENPALPGPYAVRHLTYGSGTDRRRPEYGEGAAITTETVDGTLFLENEWQGIPGYLRSSYLGFGPEALPLNAHVWLPEGEGPFPLVLIVHGNAAMQQPSETGYAYLGSLLASRGFVVAAPDMNFINPSWMGRFSMGVGPVRAWLALQHLQAWRTWSDTPDHPWFGLVDMDNVGLIGHSRGGEAVALARSFNNLARYVNGSVVDPLQDFRIKSIVALAPVDGYYFGPPIWLEDVNYLVVHGGHDAQLPNYMGIRQYERTVFTGDVYRLKAAVYAYRATHTSFNTVWARRDTGFPNRWLLNRRGAMDPEAQRTMAMVYVSAFLETTLHEDPTYLPFLRDHRYGAPWLPEDLYTTRFEDAHFYPVANFEEDYDEQTTTVLGGYIESHNPGLWGELKLHLRDVESSLQDNRVMRLRWGQVQVDQGAAYTIYLPEMFSRRLGLDAGSLLNVAAAPARKFTVPPDFTIELETIDGVVAALPFGHFARLNPPLRTEFSKAPWLVDFNVTQPVEVVLQSYTLPVAEFVAANPAFDPARLAIVRFRFDRTSEGAIYLDDVGFWVE